MTICINGKKADIILEKEKTIGDVLAGLDDWLRGSGYCLSGLETDGERADILSMDSFFEMELTGIEKLNIITSSWTGLAAEALLDLLQNIGDYEMADFEERSRFKNAWETQAASHFLQEQIPDIYGLAEKTFSGLGMPSTELRKILEERLWELENPRREINNSGHLIKGIAARLEELPLDIQTGKDGRAAETVRIFSEIAEKLFRLFNLLKIEGFNAETLTVDDIPIYTYIEEFGSALKELLAAYESRDAVLVGDLAEYELAPRLLKFYSAISNPAVSSV
ncbi:hypothetical protein FACS1894110_00190 [Spirochaetia bacterium]|nr:hypothetical protein FACS1894110_00190 [Spirochaetia bacterium]